MTSRDFSFLTLRNFTAYTAEGTPVSDNSVLTVSSYGAQKWTNNLIVNSVLASSISVSSSVTVSTIIVSSIRPSTIVDKNGSSGTAGQILSASPAGNSLEWIAPSGGGGNIQVVSTLLASSLISVEGGGEIRLQNKSGLQQAVLSNFLDDSMLSSINYGTFYCNTMVAPGKILSGYIQGDGNWAEVNVGNLYVSGQVPYSNEKASCLKGDNLGNSYLITSSFNTSSINASSITAKDISSITVTHNLITKAGSNDTLGAGGYMSQFTRLASSGSYTSDYQVTSNITQFGNIWQDARYVYKDGDGGGAPFLRQVWGIVTSTTASDLFPTSKLGDIRFFNTVKVDQLLMASTISSLNGLTNLGVAGISSMSPPTGFYNLAFNPTTGQFGYYTN